MTPHEGEKLLLMLFGNPFFSRRGSPMAMVERSKFPRHNANRLITT